jgi:glycosyltransferase involved in cell wall biosynthesis
VRVGISLLTLAPGQLGGSETYVRALTRALASAGTLEYTALVPGHCADAASGLNSVPVRELAGVRSGGGRILSMRVAAQLSSSLKHAGAELDIVHFPLTVQVRPFGRPTVVTLHDLQHRDLPELFSRPTRAFRRLAYDRAPRRAAAVIVPSRFVQERVVEELGLASERVHVIPHGVDHAVFAPGKQEREPFLLYPARPWPHKNHARLFAAFELLRSELSELRLVLTGAGVDGLQGLPGGAEVLGDMPAPRLAALYRTAACLVFPSLYEGFGLPPLEAMACGCPVAASNVGPIPEICGEAAVYFDPRDPEAIANGVREALALADELRELGLARAAGFTWEQSARRHEDVYRAAGA